MMPSQLFAIFLDDLAEQLRGLDEIVQESAPELGKLRQRAGDLFALRTGATLLGIPSVARAAAAAERALHAGLAWTTVQPPLAACAAALRDALKRLSHADASGARIEDPGALDRAALALELLGPPRVESPPAAAKPTTAPAPPSAADGPPPPTTTPPGNRRSTPT
jgi:hypothetical protein